ncbi:hypothetical protein FSP39_012165 [Pinctada imbricata]|uniref:Uncharacterized protein n=1 Tax=Pinctada imbricata TaxID=66713 RepID=A0AA88XNB7_PINIB|nr:hypothetical protein FSP39_012165 [Pinctada imbricata]
MRQSEEEKQYLLEQTQRALKREEKQKKRQKKEMPYFEIEAEAAGDIADLSVSPSSQSESAVQDSEAEKETIQNFLSVCKPCSVVLIDFVKYLKINEQSQSNEGDSCTEEEDASEDNLSQGLPLQDPYSESKDEMEKEKDPSVDVSGLVVTPTSRRRRKPSARKQAKSYNFKQRFTAEIVNYPLQNFDYNPSTTVPPLRLKIKPNVAAEPKKRGRYGKRKARKSFSPSKAPSKSFQQNQGKVDSAKGNNTGTKIENPTLVQNVQKVQELPTKGFEGSYVQFIRDKDSTNTVQNTNVTPKKHEVTTLNHLIPSLKISIKMFPRLSLSVSK